MEEISKLLFLFVGNLSKWLFYGGKKSMDEIVKEDNEILGLTLTIIIAFLFFIFYTFIK